MRYLFQSLLSLAVTLQCSEGTPLHPRQTTTKKSLKPLLQDFEALGAWYDGVAAINGTSAPRNPNVTIGIVGAGVSGLAVALMLDNVGVHNWEIIEASDRVGGRFRTRFFEGTDEWVEMGPMRLPHSITYKSDNSTHYYTDHLMTFQLADWLNELNHHDPEWEVKFIPWIQHHPNELLARGTGRINGRIPTRAEIAANPQLAAKPPLTSAEYNATKTRINGILKNEQTLRSVQADVWRAHAKVMYAGLDDISQQSMMRNIWNASENVTDAIWTSTDYDVFWDEIHHNSNLAQDGSSGTFGETEWQCVDRGFNRLSDAFIPHVSSRLKLNSKVSKLEAVRGTANQTKTRLTWSNGDKRKPVSKEYDYTIMTAPFTQTRFMELPSFSSILSRAMSERGLRFKSACKVALLFEERFWEKGERPIFGGYSQPSSTPVGALYYPVYGFNESGRPGAIIHYRGGDWSDRFVSFSDDQHVKLVLDAIVSLHGEQARDLYTGEFERLCWLQDEHTATSWTRPNVEQHALYIPAYHVIEHNTIFIGEHTAPTHAWVSSSLHSSVRGAIQLLLDIGLVDEAKTLNQRWMGRWIKKS